MTYPPLTTGESNALAGVIRAERKTYRPITGHHHWCCPDVRVAPANQQAMNRMLRQLERKGMVRRARIEPRDENGCSVGFHSTGTGKRLGYVQERKLAS